MISLIVFEGIRWHQSRVHVSTLGQRQWTRKTNCGQGRKTSRTRGWGQTKRTELSWKLSDEYLWMQPVYSTTVTKFAFATIVRGLSMWIDTKYLGDLVKDVTGERWGSFLNASSETTGSAIDYQDSHWISIDMTYLVLDVYQWWADIRKPLLSFSCILACQYCGVMIRRRDLSWRQANKLTFVWR
jgi:hypothetical protein